MTNRPMATQSTAPHQQYIDAFQAFETRVADHPQWTRDLRQAAMDRFAQLGFPTARRGNEEWKYTNVRPIATAPLQPLIDPVPTYDIGEVESFGTGHGSGPRLVFVDGAYVEAISSTEGLPQGVLVASLAQVLSSDGRVAQQHLGRHVEYETHAFTALNTAFLRDGAYLHVPDRVVVEQPVQLLFLTTGRYPDAVFQTRVLLVAGAQSEIKVVQSYSRQTEGRYLTNAVTEIVLGEGATVQLYRVQRESPQAFHIHTTQVELGRDSTFSSVAFDMGGAITRNNLNVQMAGQGASCMLNGLYVASGTQHVDNQVMVDHQVSHTTTRELYKGILDGEARAVFHGGITVRPGAQKVDAQQSDRNLLLSNRAEADAKPAFWIYADDVKCSHGATCGKLNQAAMFYLRSRGLDEREARTILTRAFANEVVNSIPWEPLRDRLGELVLARLEQLGDGE